MTTPIKWYYSILLKDRKPKTNIPCHCERNAARQPFTSTTIVLSLRAKRSATRQIVVSTEVVSKGSAVRQSG
jgi:hypothetical protein